MTAMNKESKLEQEAKEYAKKKDIDRWVFTPQQRHKFCNEDFIAGAKSEAAKEYWQSKPEQAAHASHAVEREAGKGCRWVKASKELPKKEGLYTVKTAYSVVPEKRNFTGRVFENYDGFIVVEWLDEEPTPSAGEGDAVEWISVEDGLPELLETVWVSNGKGWTTLGCRSDLYDNGEGGFNWCWCASNGIIYEEEGSIVAECEADDLNVRYWQKLPKPIQELP